MQAQSAIREWAKSNGLKLGWLAEQIPVTKTSLSRWLNEDRIPTAMARERMADVTGIDLVRDEKSWVE